MQATYIGASGTRSERVTVIAVRDSFSWPLRLRDNAGQRFWVPFEWVQFDDPLITLQHLLTDPTLQQESRSGI